MKTYRLLTLSLVLLLGVAISCTKEGLQGNDGLQGPQGETGPAGPAGQDGSVIYSGTGAPATAIGANGDYYLNRTTGDLYGPKTAGGWGSPTNLKGPAGVAGTAGTPGSKIYSGNGVPSNAQGDTGDYYLDKTNMLLYGPKNTSWGAPVLLRGAQGPQGPVGPAGANGSMIYSGNGDPAIALGKNGDYYFNKSNGSLFGPKTDSGWGSGTMLNGPQGPAGAAGSAILSGFGAPATSLGKAGDYYLDRSTYQFYGPKTASDWGQRVMLQGPQGQQGPIGPAGADGSVIYSGSGDPAPSLGKNGDFYFNSSNGSLFGPKTSNGWGSRTFLTGPQGPTGAPGTPGSAILSGNGAPAKSLGKVGDFYLDRTSYMLYGPKNATDWGLRILLQGAQGAQGPAGPAGANGSIIYSGNNVPDPALGKNGDYYFNKSTGALFGPKTNSGWGTATVLTGPQGTPGTPGQNGSTIISGFGAPTNDIGNNGDYYIDRQTFLFYGPRNVDGWGRGISLKGADGESANVSAFESADDTALSWAVAPPINTDGPPTAFVLRQTKANGDTSTIFALPQSAADIANKGVILVYLHLKPTRDDVSKWVQLSYTQSSGSFAESRTQQYYNYNTIITAAGAFVKITCDVNGSSRVAPALLEVDKVRIVAIPNTISGALGKSRQQTTMPQVMQQLNLTNKNFKTIR